MARKGTLKRGISVLGSTGSIGTQALEVASAFKPKFSIIGLATKINLELLEEQVKKFSPKLVSVENEEMAEKLIRKLGKTTTAVYFGKDGLKKVAVDEDVDILVVAIPGIAGLLPTIEAIRSGKKIALASKEILVTAGKIIMEEAKSKKAKIFPVDSEHSAISQILKGEDIKKIKRVILTASGGPLLESPLEDLKKVSPTEALAHPTWNMGQKISIDSATLMNKGFEVIEALHLFGLDYSKIEVLIHPQSIIHSMIEFIDGSILAQMSSPDMRLPIQYALFSNDRALNSWSRLDFSKLEALTFSKVDTSRFPCLELAFEAGKLGGTYPAVLNAADEVAVDLFLKGKITFTDIPDLISKTLEKHKMTEMPSLEDIFEADSWTREELLSNQS